MSTETAEATSGTSEKPEGFIEEFRVGWQTLSCKGFFFGLLAAWLALFHFIGNSTLGYFNNPSLLEWMRDIYAHEPNEGHGNLILPAVLILFWWKRKELLSIPQRAWWPGLFFVGFGIFFHVFGFLVQQPKISVCAMFLGAYGLIGLTWGRSWMRSSFFPFFLFVFCVPISGSIEKLTFSMRLLATNITYGVTHGVFGLAVVQKGTQLFDSSGAYSYDVAAACSGIRSLISLLALTTIYGMMTFKSTWKRLLIISMAVPLAIACNVIRLTSIIIGAEAFGQKTGNFIHEWSGFLTYVVAIIVMLLMGVWLREREPASNNLRSQTT